MRSEATSNKDVDVGPLMILFGRFFQARDDYQNLESTEVSFAAVPNNMHRRLTMQLSKQYTQQKGLADDISEGKISLPLIHALSAKSIQRGRLLSILQQRKSGVTLSDEVLKMAVDEIRATGGLDYARKIALSLQEAVDTSLSVFETRMSAKNYILRLVQKRLELDI